MLRNTVSILFLFLSILALPLYCHASKEEDNFVLPDFSYMTYQGRFPDYNARWFRNLDRIGFEVQFPSSQKNYSIDNDLKSKCVRQLELCGLKCIDFADAASQKLPLLVLKIIPIPDTENDVLLSIDFIREVQLRSNDSIESGFTSVWHKFYFSHTAVASEMILTRALPQFADLNARAKKLNPMQQMRH